MYNSALPEYPRLLFSIHLSEDVEPNEVSPHLFADWLPYLPSASSLVRVEFKDGVHVSGYLSQPVSNGSFNHLLTDSQMVPLSPAQSESTASPSLEVPKGEDDMPSIYSLPVENEQQVVLAKMKPAHLAFNWPLSEGKFQRTSAIRYTNLEH
jgi:hypothetical protein